MLPYIARSIALNLKPKSLMISGLVSASLLISGCNGGTQTASSDSLSISSSHHSSISASSIPTPSSMASSAVASVVSSTPSSSSSIQSSTRSQSSSSRESSNQPEPPFAGTVYMDPDIFTPQDATTYQGLEYLGQKVVDVYDSNQEPKTTKQNVYSFTLNFSDGLKTEVQAVPAFGNQAAAQTQAGILGNALGRLPKQLRAGVKTITALKGKGRANANGGQGILRIYSELNEPLTLEELLAHESAHVSLDPVYRYNNLWLHAQHADASFISTYARDNGETEDIAESVLMYLAVRYKTGRISPENAAKIHRTMPNRIAFFDQIFTDLHPMTDLSGQLKAKLIAPVNTYNARHTLASSEITFTWSTPTDAAAYDLVLGTKGYGSNDLRASSTVKNNTLSVTGLPSDGTPVFARLWTQKNNAWRFDDYRFTGFNPNRETASIALPVPNTQFQRNTITFQWDDVFGATQYDVVIGTQGAGSNDVRASQPLNTTELTLNNLPQDEEAIYVRLWTLKNGWNYEDFEYTASQSRAKLKSPTPNSRINQSTLNIEWETLASATNYDVLIGTTGPGSDDIRASAPQRSTSLTLNSLPTNGQKIYLRLWTKKSEWRYIDYTFN